MTSKIEQTIEDMEQLVSSCKFKAFSTTQIIVDKEEIESLIDELRKRAPEEIKQYQKIISNREAIINDAKAKAQDLINQASAQTSELISQHEIMLKAYEQANQIVDEAIYKAQEIMDDATLEANELKMSAMQYTDSLLAQVEDIVGHYLGQTNTKYNEMMNSLNECYDVVRSNRQELIEDAAQDSGVDIEEFLADSAPSEPRVNSNASGQANMEQIQPQMMPGQPPMASGQPVDAPVMNGNNGLPVANGNVNMDLI